MREVEGVPCKKVRSARLRSSLAGESGGLIEIRLNVGLRQDEIGAAGGTVQESIGGSVVAWVSARILLTHGLDARFRQPLLLLAAAPL